MQVSIRPAVESELGEILQFVKLLAKYEKLENEVVATVDKFRRSLFGAQKYAEVLFLEEDGKKVGIALFFHNYSTFLGQPGLYLEDLFVLPECRGRGYGKRLLAYLAQLSIERKCGRFEWSVLDWNKPAIEFYHSVGAKPLSEWTVYRLTGEELIKLAESSQD